MYTSRRVRRGNVAEPSPPSCVLVVADRERAGELVAALSELSRVEVLVSTGGDDTIELFASRRPAVVVVTASLEVGDTRSLMVALRAMVPRGHVAVVLIGDDAGPIRTALDALELAPDRFVTRPLSAKALRFAVTGGIDAVRVVRGTRPQPPIAAGTLPGLAGDAREPAAPRTVSSVPAELTRAALRARWAALADAITDGSEDDAGAGEADPAPEVAAADTNQGSEAGPERRAEAVRPGAASRLHRIAGASSSVDETAAPGSVVIQPRNRQTESPRDDAPAPPGGPDELVPVREPTLILRDPPAPAVARTVSEDGEVVVAARTSSDELWSEPVAMAELPERESRPDAATAPHLHQPGAHRPGDAPGGARGSSDLQAPVDEPPAARLAGTITSAPAPRDFARELRAKMSMMAQRLFQGGPAPAPHDHVPRHDHHTEIDLSSLGDEPVLVGGELEPPAAPKPDVRDVRDARDGATSPGSWDTQVRERGLPDSGTIVRGVSDAPMLLARMFALSATGRLRFRRDDVETVVHCDRGRPVFASSNEPRDRMGELLLREGKITAAQYERCQTVVAESGRRMGEILVDFGYLKRRELLPAVRRHVEDLVYSLFGWERGTYGIALDAQPCAERIRLSRHPAALILEGIRRKLDRASLERLVGPLSTVIEVRDRERLGGIVQLGDLTVEERGALSAFDGQADLGQVARAAAVGVAEILPLAWGLCVLGLASARRSDTDVPDEAPTLVGETDLAIDRERVRARWQLVTEADYFALLGVRRDATGFEIRRAYQSARRDFAADCFPSDLRRELARELDDIAHVLDEAFRVLRDDRLRERYLVNLIDR